ncbi:hypothetical protein [Bradyrhizobium niftali]|uniref:hypothetical protein n=1 Tax=Bradyrhizobium niftali TaxID=2560055 RepID=UPI003D31039D
MAAALSVRKVGLSELQARSLLRDDVRALMRKVEIVCPHEPTLAASDRVAVQMDDGRLFDSGEIEEARGGIAHPLDSRRTRGKVHGLRGGEWARCRSPVRSAATARGPRRSDPARCMRSSPLGAGARRGLAAFAEWVSSTRSQHRTTANGDHLACHILR